MYCRDLTNCVECFKGATACFLFFPLSISSSYHLVTNSVSIESPWTPRFYSFVCCCQVGTPCELVCEHLIFLQKNACLSSFFIGIENLIAPVCITFANVIDIKNMNSIADTAWIFFKRLRAFNNPVYRSVQLARKAEIFRFSFEVFFQEKGIVAKLILYFAGWMVTIFPGNMTVKQRNFQFPQKGKQFPSLLVGNNDFFFESMFFEKHLSLSWVNDITLKKTLN